MSLTVSFLLEHSVESTIQIVYTHVLYGQLPIWKGRPSITETLLSSWNRVCLL